MDEKEQQRKDIFDRLEKLPPELKDVMFSGVTAEKMFDIGKRHSLLVDKLGDMAHETGLLMLGVTHPDEFVGNLATRLEVNKETANTIADDINREIFSPVREHLRAVFGGTAGQGEIPTNKIPPGLPFSKGGEKSIPPLEKGVMGDLQGTSTKPETSLEDLEAELEHALAGQKGEQPLSVVKQQHSETISKARDIYKGADPYREQIEEHIPNTQGAPYVPPKPNHESGIMNYGKEEPKPIKEISIATPTPKPVEEPSVFSPLSPKPSSNGQEASRATGPKPYNPSSKLRVQSPDPYREDFTQDIIGVKNPSLQAFRGFNMNNLPKRQQLDKNQGKEEQQSQQQKPVNGASDLPRYGFSKQPPYREKPEA